MTKSILHRLSGAYAAIALAAALGGCGQQKASDQQMTVASLPQLPATLPLAAGPATNWPTAPLATALPAAHRLRTVRVADPGDYYGYADAAYDYQDALGNAPPDYSFDYGGVDPWAWEGYDQSVVFMEPVDDGYRYYYYRPGADEPYFVRDPHYGYGYDGGSLAVVYDDFGEVMPYSDYGPRLDYASRYFMRGRDLFAASRRAERRAVIAADWAQHEATIADARARWANALAGQAQWRDFHARTEARDATYWREEDVRRQSDARRFADWRAQDFRTPPPPRAIPQAWTRAPWASDQARFLPARAERAQVAGAQPPRRDGPGGPGAPGGPDGGRVDQRGPDNAPALAAAGARGIGEPNRGGREGAPMAVDRGPAGRDAGPPRDRGNANPGRERGPAAANAQPRAEAPQAGPRGNPQVARERGPERGGARIQSPAQAEGPRVQRGNGDAARERAQPQPQMQARPEQRGGDRGQPARAPEAQRAPRAEAPRAQPQPSAPRPQAQAQPQRGGGGGGQPGGGRPGGGGGEHPGGGGGHPGGGGRPAGGDGGKHGGGRPG
ncbi:MAG: hypothetical protein J0I47_10175 [Sphingomonas sp.]|uniref:hypothetical protein n=1 Tax=Sphingomonas sp. TaxID=28214 RepID=UPI001AD4BD57|nr:hypothetical protein [Sphingomonas sp.]MBN8808579.1 hypothetical protein [Sphingomonas sp.]